MLLMVESLPPYAPIVLIAESNHYPPTRQDPESPTNSMKVIFQPRTHGMGMVFICAIPSKVELCTHIGGWSPIFQ